MPKGHNITAPERRSIVEMYIQNAGNTHEIAAANNVSRQTVYRVLEKAGLYAPRRRKGTRSQKLKPVPPSKGFFSGWFQNLFR